VGDVADAIGVTTLEAAAGIHEVVNANMADGLRIVSMQRGHDPREFALVVAGGAGPIHAAQLAAELEIPLTVIPRDASVFCAVGMLLTDLKHSYVRTFTSATDGVDRTRLHASLESMRAEAVATLHSEAIGDADIDVGFSADVRYVGQYSEVEVPLESPNGSVSEEMLAQMVDGFHRLHDVRYGYALPGSPTEIVNVRARSRGHRDKPELGGSGGEGAAAAATKSSRMAYFGGELRETPVYDALALGTGCVVDGPAILEQPTTTIVVPPRSRLRVEAGAFLLAPAGADIDSVLNRLRTGA
jgi:N-methylhydantoinase A